MYEIKTPFYINTEFNYFCERCGMLEPKLITEKLYQVNGDLDAVATSTTLTCEHYTMCCQLMHNLRYVQKAERKEEG